MYYRRKYLIALGQYFGNQLDNLRFQKLLFIATRRQEKKLFDFVPYKYGCFSFQANQDMSAMYKRQFIGKSDENWDLSNSQKYYNELKREDQASIVSTYNEFKEYSNDELIKFTYENYPYFAINSRIAHKVVDSEHFDKIKKQKRIHNEQAFFTIGYEGISLEKYLNKLIINGVELLVDVRKNPLSMKYGFSKNQLMKSVEGVGIQYLHIPDLGIESSERKTLTSLKDYRILFDKYKKTTLKENSNQLDELIKLLGTHGRIAITCFEKEVCMCHRGEIANALKRKKSWSAPIKNL